DLFEHGPGLATVRPFAVGLPNGHNLLFDLDTLGLRRWWVGDFARQNVRGKKWYWETAGITLVDLPDAPPLVAVPPPPPRSGQTVGWLEWYEHTADGVRLRFRLQPSDVPVELTVAPLSDGWSARIEAAGLKPDLGSIAGDEGGTLQTPAGPASVQTLVGRRP